VKVTFVTAQLLGYDRVGGVGTATTFLALGLARGGHEVEVLYVGDAQATEGEWARLYADAAVKVRTLLVDESVQPRPFARASSVEHALRADPPRIVIAHDFGAPAYVAQRLRQVGLGFRDTLFVVFCHGTRRWVKEVTNNASVSGELMLESSLERASVELADAVVSPSAFMLDWMRRQGWDVPDRAHVIPYVTRSAALGETLPPRPTAGHRPVERLTFFGRLEEIKGIAPFLAAVNALDPALLRFVELEFLGTTTKHWTQERVERSVTAPFRRISFASNLDQHEVLERLSRSGTIAVMPSLADNSPNTVYECLERGIPFIASDSGGIAELVAPEERARVLFEPTAAGIEGALRQALTAPDALRPARPAFDGPASLAAWQSVLQLSPPARVPAARRPVDESDFGLVVQDGDEPDAELFETLVRAQATSGADAVTCGARTPEGVTLFAGQTGGLQILGNHYGAAALVRRSLLDGTDRRHPWPLLARLDADGGRIVSVPLPLVTRSQPVARDPHDAVLVVEEAEHGLPREARSLARLVAGLAADAERRAG
jgi:O-antigen biosynthesis protein